MSDRRIDWDEIRGRLEASAEALERNVEPTADELAAALDRRAAALANRAVRRTRRDERADRVLVVGLEDERYGLPIERLAEVVPLRRLTGVPAAPRELLGVMNLRGEVRSVVDLREVLGLARGEGRPEGYVLMVRNGKGETGLFVERVEGIEAVRRTGLTPSPDAHYVTGLLPGRIGLLDVDALLAHAAPAGAGSRS